jgi:ribonuclease VapC
MVVDTSAIMAVLLGEPDAELFARALAGDEKRVISAFTALESAIVIEAKKGDAGGRELDLLLHYARVEIVAMDPAQSELARIAWRTYGKGSHSAGLNIGDCCSYALSKYSGEPLLCKGEDFSKTDIKIVQLQGTEGEAGNNQNR